MSNYIYNTNLLIQIIRQKKSYDFKFVQAIQNNYLNNTKNNCIDTIQIIKKNIILFESNSVQTIANHPFMNFQDTLHTGNFEIKCFVESRNFHGRIHGIINAKDIENQNIGPYSMQIENGETKGRWLIHDKYYKKINGETQHAYSGGCFILSIDDLKKFNKCLLSNGIEDFVLKKINKHYILKANLKEI